MSATKTAQLTIKTRAGVIISGEPSLKPQFTSVTIRSCKYAFQNVPETLHVLKHFKISP